MAFFFMLQRYENNFYNCDFLKKIAFPSAKIDIKIAFPNAKFHTKITFPSAKMEF